MANQNGFYRAKVVDPKDPDDYGKVKVWIPDLMPKIPETKGMWAFPANNPSGGLNDEGDESHYYSGSTRIPAKGSWIWVFFENGKNDRPYYWAALDIENSKILPENRVGSNKHKKWVIYKSNKGRTIIISDDSSDARVEITGRKRQINDPPSGDTDSVYTINDNMTTILLDERPDSEKLLIKTYQGDFLKIGIKDRTLQASFKNDISITSEANINLNGKNININASENINNKSGKDININSAAAVNIQAETTANVSAFGDANISGKNVNYEGSNLQLCVVINGVSVYGEPAQNNTSGGTESATTVTPVGDRDSS